MALQGVVGKREQKGGSAVKRSAVYAAIGLVLLIAGIYVSTLMTTAWIVIGTGMAIIGGGITGISAYLLGSGRQ